MFTISKFHFLGQRIRRNNIPRLVLLDADGVLWEDGAGLLTSKHFVLPETTSDILKTFGKDTHVVVVTNQTSYANGRMGIIPFLFRIHINSWKLLNATSIKAVIVCCHHPESDRLFAKRKCKCRKPQSAMLDKALRYLNPVKTLTYFVGDRISDAEAANRAQVKNVFLLLNSRLFERNVMFHKFEPLPTIRFEILRNFNEFPKVFFDNPQSQPQLLILAAGEGRRLRPLTLEIPKPVISLGEQTIISRILRQFSHQEFVIYVNISYLAPFFVHHLYESKLPSLRIVFLFEVNPLGTTNTVLSLLQHSPSPTLVLHGDLVFSSESAEHLIKTFLESHTSTIFYHLRIRSESRSMLTLKEDIVQSFQELQKSLLKESDKAVMVNSGAYIFHPNILENNYDLQIKSDLVESLIPDLVSRKQLTGIPWKGVRFSVDSFDSLEKAVHFVEHDELQDS